MRSLFIPNLKEGVLDLPEEEVRHAVRVLRAKIGFSYVLIDGQGGTAEGVIIAFLYYGSRSGDSSSTNDTWSYYDRCPHKKD